MTTDLASAPTAPSVLTGKTVPYTEALLAQLTVGVIIPLLMFGVMLAFVFWVIWRAQKASDNDFHIEHILLDETTGRVSILKFLSLLTFCSSTWYLAAALLSTRPDWQIYAIYVVTWAGTPALMLAAQKWNGNFPFSHPPSNNQGNSP
jgi:hypothetical protein